MAIKIDGVYIFPEAFYRIEHIEVENSDYSKYFFADGQPYKDHRSASRKFDGDVYSGYELIDLHEKLPQSFYNRTIDKKKKF